MQLLRYMGIKKKLYKIQGWSRKKGNGRKLSVDIRCWVSRIQNPLIKISRFTVVKVILVLTLERIKPNTLV